MQTGKETEIQRVRAYVQLPAEKETVTQPSEVLPQGGLDVVKFVISYTPSTDRQLLYSNL